MLDFVVVDEDCLYKIILGRTFLRISKAVVSNHYLALKYQVNDVVGVVKGDQRIAWSCYVIAAETAIQIILLDTRGDAKKDRQEPVEEVETISIKREEPEKIIKIGLKIEADFKKKKGLWTVYKRMQMCLLGRMTTCL